MKYTIVVTHPDQTQETYTFRSGDKAYKAYDRAIQLGYYVDRFTFDRTGEDMRDRAQDSIGWTA